MKSLGSNSRTPSLSLVYAGAALLILVLLVGSAIVISRLRDAAMLDEARDLKNLSLTLAEQADRSFLSVDLVLSSTIDGLMKDGVSDAALFDRQIRGYDFHQSLREKMTGIPQLDAVVVEDRDGKVINFSRFWPIPDIDNSDRDYFRALKSDPNLKSYISNPVQNRGSGTWTIFLARRVNGPKGEFLGVILGGIQLSYFEDFYRAITPAEDSSIALQRSDGVMLARFPATDAIGRTFSTAEHLLQGGSSGFMREVSPIDGRMRLKAAHRLANFPVVALATESEDTALATWRGIAWLISLAALGCALSIGIAAFAFARQWTQHSVLAHAQAELKRKEDLADALEAMRTAKEEAEMADNAKGEFLANMSHELRTPLNAVIGFSELMLGEHFGPLGSDHYRGYARDIHDSGTHLLDIINDILDLSKAASGTLTLVEDWFDAREAVNSVCRFIRVRADDGKLSLAVNMPPGDLSIYADERMLKQMLLNMLSNACKFTPADGRVVCSLSMDSTSVTFTVSDTGIGIPPEHLERVLKPFVQVESSMSRRHEGTGLGLALVKVMAELHGGSLRLDSEVDKGTTVVVTLPVHRVRRIDAGVPELLAKLDQRTKALASAATE
jgi:signal transduction histidine kinase